MSAREVAADRARAVIRAATVRLGGYTAGVRMLPGFLLVGAQRCGTTSLHRALIAHPAVVPPAFHKGVNYFDVNYPRGLRWYQGHFPVASLAHRRVRPFSAPMTGESSGYYIHHPMAASRIAHDLPDARLLAVIRDPVERAYSAHRHETVRGFETEPLERALELEPVRLQGEVERLVADPGYESYAHRHHAYVDRGRYAPQIQRLYDTVGRDRVLVIDADDFFAFPEREYARVLSFLGLPAWSPREFRQHNARPRAPMAQETRAWLRGQFGESDEQLPALLGWTPSWLR